MISFAAKAEDASTLFWRALSLLSFLGFLIFFVSAVCERFFFEGETDSLVSSTAMAFCGFHRSIKS